jgi:hypothetical protein
MGFQGNDIRILHIVNYTIINPEYFLIFKIKNNI